MKDEAELVPVRHTRGRHGITGMHTGRGFAGERACLPPEANQSTSVHGLRAERVGHEATGVVDVGGGCIRLRSNLKNPSTSVDGE